MTSRRTSRSHIRVLAHCRTRALTRALLAVEIAALGGFASIACSCAHPTRIDDAWVRPEPASLAELEARVWPNRDDRWRPLREAELVALARLVDLLLVEAERGAPSLAQQRRATSLATAAGVELRHLEIETERQRVSLWVLTEPVDDRRGRGAYVIRLGPVGPADASVRPDSPELVVEAPHSRFDRGTGAIALRLLLESVEGSPRAVFLNSAHRYRQLDGTRTRNPTPERNPADAAHNPEHPLARTTAWVLARRDIAVVQLHGFAPARPTDPTVQTTFLTTLRTGFPPQSRTASPAPVSPPSPAPSPTDVAAPLAQPEQAEPDLIVSAGAARPSRASAATFERLQAGVPEHRCAQFGVDSDRLGGQHNVQAKAARAAGRCFVHLELSQALRRDLLEQPELLRRFATAILDSGPSTDARKRDHGCR